jgi:hypothetical protein
MHRLGTSVIALSMLFALQGCGVAKRLARSPETDALFRAARVGNADTVRALIASPNVDVNGIDEHGNTPLIEAARFGHDEVVTVAREPEIKLRLLRPMHIPPPFAIIFP